MKKKKNPLQYDHIVSLNIDDCKWFSGIFALLFLVDNNSQDERNAERALDLKKKEL